MEAQIRQAEEEVVAATAVVSAATEAMGRAVAAAEEVRLSRCFDFSVAMGVGGPCLLGSCVWCCWWCSEWCPVGDVLTSLV